MNKKSILKELIEVTETMKKQNESYRDTMSDQSPRTQMKIVIGSGKERKKNFTK